MFRNLFYPVLPVLLCMPVLDARGSELYFNINALNLTEGQRKQMDLNLLSRTDIQMPGEYEVILRVNRENTGKYTIKFVECDNTLCPELTPALLGEAGVNISAIRELNILDKNSVILHPGKYIPGADVQFDFERTTLYLSIPQIAMTRRARGYIPPEQWNDGLPMLFTSYTATGSKSRYRRTDESESSHYVDLRNGINLGPWRLRNNSNYQYNSKNSKWNALQTWLERDIRSLYSRLVVGETSTPGLIFDNISFRGVSLSSQDSMLPDGMQGYAPEINGVAVTNATVEIRQNDNLIYQTYVSPGEFVINDMYVPPTSGDLEITIREEDGSVRTYMQSFASPPISVRKDRLKYSVTTGEFGSRYYRHNHAVRQRFGQTEFLYGVLNNTSLYSGLIVAGHYRSGMLGVGQGLGKMGALSVDTAYAKTHFDSGEKQGGQSWRLRYNKRFDVTGTNMTLAGYRYASDGYYDFADASNSFYTQGRNNRSVLKSRTQLNFSQNIGPFGAISLSANRWTYWSEHHSRSRGLTGTWNKTFNGIAVNLSQSQNKNWHSGRTDSVTSVNISLPVDRWLSGHSNYRLRMSNNFTRSDTGLSALNSTLSGIVPGDQELAWSVTQSRNKQATGITTDSTSMSGTYQNSFSRISTGYSDYYGQNQRLNWGTRGAVVAHPYGVTLSQPLSEGSSYALIRAPGANGVKVKNRAGLTTDWRGYAVIPYMTAYRENTVVLDTTTLNENVELSEAVQSVTPTREALVLTDYDTRLGHRVLLSLKHNGVPVPFGAIVSSGDSQGITNENGQVYLSGLADGADFVITLPEGKRCGGIFEAEKASKRNGIMMAGMECN